MLICLCFFVNTAKSQTGCTSIAVTYDQVFSNYTVFPPTPSGLYTLGYICNGVTVIDSMSCCTRMIHVETGAVFIAGPFSYGTAYVKSGGTFNGQNTAQNWFVYAEAGANVLNYTGTVVSCTAVSFPTANCFMNVHSTEPEEQVKLIQLPGQIQFSVPSANGNTRIELYDISGKQLINQSAENTSVISMSTESLSGGMYFYRVYQNEELLSTGKIALAK